MQLTVYDQKQGLYFVSLIMLMIPSESSAKSSVVADDR